MRTPARALAALLAVALTSCVMVAAGAAEPYAGREDVRRFIAEMVDRHGFDAKVLRTVFGQARFQPSVIKAITPPIAPRARSWQAYRGLFLTPQRIEGGVEFRGRNREALARAVELYGVPEEIIIAIIGVETVYGRNTGNYRVIDALATLAFDYPPRAEYFRAELENLLLYARDAGIDALSLKGSFAGAIGIPQFMPGTYRRYAVDLDGDGKQDLSGSAADAIGSVANFLQAHGWETGRPVAVAAQVQGERYRDLVDAGIKPVYRYGDLTYFGVVAEGEVAAGGVTEGEVAAGEVARGEVARGEVAAGEVARGEITPDAPCTLVELATPGEASRYLVGFTNFYVLTRYNRSSFYAAAVLDLAQAVKSAYTPK